MSKQSLLMLIWLVVGLCARPSHAAQPHALATPPPVAYQNDILGVQVRDTLGLRVVEDSMLAGASTWGFSLVKNKNGGNGALVLSMSLVYQEPPAVNQAIAKAIAAAPKLPIQQMAITVDGLPGKALITGTMVPTPTTAISTYVLLRLEGEIPASLALDRQAIYWVAWPGFQKIYRYPLVAAAQTPITITVVATSHYPAGVLVQAPLLRTGDWLIFHDSAHAAISNTWQLRALNLTDGTERILAKSKGNAIVYGIAATNNRVVWSWLDHHAERACQDEAVLSLLDLATNQQIELNRACFQTEHYWGTVSMDGDRLVADFWRENTEPGKILGDIVLFDLSAPDPTQFTFLKASPPARRNAFPRLTGEWVSWVRGTQNQGNCVLFNLQTQTQRALPTEWSQTSCQFVGAAAGWFWSLDSVNTPNILLYQPDQQRSGRLRLHTQGHIDAAAIMDNTIVVAVRLNPEQTKVIRSVIEWARLEQP